MVPIRLYAILLLVVILASASIPMVSVSQSQKTDNTNSINLGINNPIKIVVPSYYGRPAPVPRAGSIKINAVKLVSNIVSKTDRNKDFIDDSLIAKLSSGVYTNNDEIGILVMFKENPPISDTEKNLALARLLGDIIRQLQLKYPVKPVGIYTYALVGFTVKIPANLTLLEEIKNYLQNIDLNNDGRGDLWVIIDVTNREKRLYNYYSGKTLYLRPWVWDNLGYTGKGVTASASDTGIDDSHPAFTGRVLSYWSQNTGEDPSAAYDPGSHGTHVSGTMAGYYASTDSQGRLVATTDYSLDYSSTGWYSLYDLVVKVDDTGTINVTVYQSGGDILDRFCLFYVGNYPRYYAAVKGYVENITCIDTTQDTWNTMLYNVTDSSKYGYYYVRYHITASTRRRDTSSEHWIIHWPVNTTSPDGRPYFTGIAYEAGIVMANIFYDYNTDPTVDALNWIIQVRTTYNITTHNMSWGYSGTVADVETAVTNLANSGVIPVVAAGNDGPGSGNASKTTPAENAIAITVAALDQWTNNITFYSSDGGQATDYPGTYKPDLACIGGGANTMVFSADSNDAEEYSPTGNEVTPNDTLAMMGTSMATPHVTGIMTLASQAYREYLNTYAGRDWDWNSATDVLFLKNLALISTYETYPAIRTLNASYSPTLDKGGWDPHEGYGAIDPYPLLAAIKNLPKPLVPGAVVNGWFRDGIWWNGSAEFPNIHEYGPSVWIQALVFPSKSITLPNGTTIDNVNYTIKLYLANGANNAKTDLDLYLYNYTGKAVNTSSEVVYGIPIILASSTQGFGYNETIRYTPPSNDWITWLAVKRAREDSAGGNWVVVITPSVSEYGTPEGGNTADQPGQAWIGWPVKINGTASKDVSRIVIEIWASNGTRLAVLDSVNGDVRIVDPVYYTYYEANYTLPYDTNLVGQNLTIITYLYDSSGTLVEGPTTQSGIVVNSATAPVPEPILTPIIAVIVLFAAVYFVMRRR